jgi:hypothetical protein
MHHSESLLHFWQYWFSCVGVMRVSSIYLVLYPFSIIGVVLLGGCAFFLKIKLGSSIFEVEASGFFEQIFYNSSLCLILGLFINLPQWLASSFRIGGWYIALFF